MAYLKEVKSKSAKITLSDGVERTLRYTLNALSELEDRYGSVDAAFKKLDENSIKAVRCILWAGLLHEKPALTELEVGDLIDVEYMQELMESIGGAFKADLPTAEAVPLAVASNEVQEDPNF